MRIYLDKLMADLLSIVLKNKYIKTYPANPGINRMKNIVYNHKTKQKLDIYYPDHASNLPVILYIHGGGWYSGSKELLEGYGRMMAAKSYICVGIDYRLTPKFKYPDAIYDVFAAYNWAQENIARYGGNSDKIYLAGDSAGANLAMAFACACINPVYAAYYPGIHTNKAAIRGLLLWYGIYDIETGIVSGFPNAREMCQAYIGNENEKLDKFQLSKYITIDFPPIFMTSSEIDPLHSLQSLNFSTKLQQKGVVVKPYFFDKTNKSALHGYIINYSLECTKEAIEAQFEFLEYVERGAV